MFRNFYGFYLSYDSFYNFLFLYLYLLVCDKKFCVFFCNVLILKYIIYFELNRIVLVCWGFKLKFCNREDIKL